MNARNPWRQQRVLKGCGLARFDPFWDILESVQFWELAIASSAGMTLRSVIAEISLGASNGKVIVYGIWRQMIEFSGGHDEGFAGSLVMAWPEEIA